MGKLVNLRHLDIRGTRLKELPVQLSQLENLQTLSNFVVGKHDTGLKIADLGRYPHLQGNLSISRLQNVTDPSHASQANLEMKKQIDELVLRWFNDTPSYSQIQSDVFELLRPSTNLKSLSIYGYGGNNFPTWLGDSSFGNMVHLNIYLCEYCSCIGQVKSVKSIGSEFYGSDSPLFQPFPLLETLKFYSMPQWEEWKLTGGNLKELRIEKMKSLKTLGTEFYGSSSSPLFQPFPSLETLEFRQMEEWEEWKLIGGTTIEFPSLTLLLLFECPKHKGNIPGNLPSLTHLSLNKCPKFKGNIPGSLPSLTSLSLEYCTDLKGMTPNNLPSLSKLVIEECPLLMDSRHLDDNSNIIITSPSSDVFSQLMTCLNSLRKLNLSNIPSLTSFPRDGLPKTLQSLTIRDCENLEFLPRESLHNYKSLENLSIDSSFVEDALQHNLLFLRSLKIWSCDELESVSLCGFPIPNLIELRVRWCKKLRSLPEPMNLLASLREMSICTLPNLQSFSIDDFPISLRELRVGIVAGILWNTTWERLKFSDDILKAVMNMEVPLLPVFLVTLLIFDVEDIGCLDGMWLQHLTSLKTLEFSGCCNLKSLPKERLPSSLKELLIYECPLLKASLLGKRGKEWRKIAHIPTIIID
ncbi:CC-NBS-LRR resistance protein, partial [Trifolium medium]|nr:CC-NBS-LRR resistance protein [Trifolium medium]